MCCSVFVLEKTRWVGTAKVFVQTKRILAFIRMALSLHANVQNLGWSLAREILKKIPPRFHLFVLGIFHFSLA